MEVYVHFLVEPWFNKDRKEDFDELEIFIISCSWSSDLIKKKTITFHDDFFTEVLLMKQEMKIKDNGAFSITCLDTERILYRLRLFNFEKTNLPKYFKGFYNAPKHSHLSFLSQYNKQQIYKKGLFYLIKKLNLDVDVVKNIRVYLY